MNTEMWIVALISYALLQVLVIAATLWLAMRWLDRRGAAWGRRRMTWLDVTLDRWQAKARITPEQRSELHDSEKLIARANRDWYAKHGPLPADAPLWISGSGREQWAREQRARKGIREDYRHV